MQIIFHTHFPKEIKGSLVYERGQAFTKTDPIDDLFVEVVQNVSSQISDEPTVISQYQNVAFSDFNFSKYHSGKTIKLHLKNMDDNSVSPVILLITVHFNTADVHFIDRRIKDEQIFNLSQLYFNKLNTLIVQ